MKYTFCFILSLLLVTVSCSSDKKKKIVNTSEKPVQYITVLGIAQDAGYPQINCEKECCKAYYEGKEPKKLVSCLGLVDTNTQTKYIFDATPDFTEQTQILKDYHLDNGSVIDGVFLTHAHIGHYTGIMFLGREAMGAKNVPTYVMPNMKGYLEKNGPWSQLVSLNNIELQEMKSDTMITLNSNLKVTPFLVPHRDEFSETVGYKIQGRGKSALFIPDINKWELWERSIVEEVKKVDYAFLDATFFKEGEIPRPMSEVPHPFVVETVSIFTNETAEIKNKIHFIHFNHSNPALQERHHLKDSIIHLGFNFAKEGDIYAL